MILTIFLYYDKSNNFYFISTTKHKMFSVDVGEQLTVNKCQEANQCHLLFSCLFYLQGKICWNGKYKENNDERKLKLGYVALSEEDILGSYQWLPNASLQTNYRRRLEMDRDDQRGRNIKFKNPEERFQFAQVKEQQEGHWSQKGISQCERNKKMQVERWTGSSSCRNKCGL